MKIAFSSRRALQVLALFCLGVFALNTLQSSAQAAPFKSKNGYSLTAPAKWKINQSSKDGTDVMLAAPPANGFTSNMKVVVAYASQGKSLARVCDECEWCEDDGEFCRWEGECEYCFSKPATTLAQIKTELVATHSKTLTGFKLQKQSTVPFAGTKALVIDATYKVGSPAKLIKISQTIAIRGSKTYIITSTAPAATFKNYQPAFSDVLKSVRLTP